MIAPLTDRLLRATLRRKRIPMSKLESITGAADRAKTELREQLGGDAASVALAIALGKLCAESGVSLADALAMAEVTHREVSAEQARGAATAA
jgi:hypothetical protein